MTQEEIIQYKVKRMVASAQKQIMKNLRAYCLQNQFSAIIEVTLTVDTEIEMIEQGENSADR